MPVLTPHVPDGLIDLMKALTKSILKEKPENIYEFAVQHFEKLIIERDGSLDKGYEIFRSEEKYFKSLAKHRKSLRTSQPTESSSTFSQYEQINTNDDEEEGGIQPSQSSVQRKFKPRKLSSRKPSEGLISIKEEDDEEGSKVEIECEIRRREWAAFKIQKAFRKFQEKLLKKDEPQRKHMTEEVAALIIQRSLKAMFSNRLKQSKSGAQSSKSDRGTVRTKENFQNILPENLNERELDISKKITSLGSTVLRQNSDDQHPSIAFGERCVDSESKQEELKGDSVDQKLDTENAVPVLLGESDKIVNEKATNETDFSGTKSTLDDGSNGSIAESRNECKPMTSDNLESEKKSDIVEDDNKTEDAVDIPLKVESPTSNASANASSLTETSEPNLAQTDYPAREKDLTVHGSVDDINSVPENQITERMSDDENQLRDGSKKYVKSGSNPNKDEQSALPIIRSDEEVVNISTEKESLTSIIKNGKDTVSSESLVPSVDEVDKAHVHLDENSDLNPSNTVDIAGGISDAKSENLPNPLGKSQTDNLEAKQSDTKLSQQTTVDQPSEDEKEGFKSTSKGKPDDIIEETNIVPLLAGQKSFAVNDTKSAQSTSPTPVVDGDRLDVTSENTTEERLSLMQLLKEQKTFIDEERKNAGFPENDQLTRQVITTSETTLLLDKKDLSTENGEEVHNLPGEEDTSLSHTSENLDKKQSESKHSTKEIISSSCEQNMSSDVKIDKEQPNEASTTSVASNLNSMDCNENKVVPAMINTIAEAAEIKRSISGQKVEKLDAANKNGGSETPVQNPESVKIKSKESESPVQEEKKYDMASDQESLVTSLRDFKSKSQKKTAGSNEEEEHLESTTGVNEAEVSIVSATVDNLGSQTEESVSMLVKPDSGESNVLYMGGNDNSSIDDKSENVEIVKTTSIDKEPDSSSNEDKPSQEHEAATELNVSQESAKHQMEAIGLMNDGSRNSVNDENSSAIMKGIEQTDETSLEMNNRGMTPTNQHNEPAELSVHVFEAGDNKENDAGNPSAAGLSDETGKHEESKAKHQGKDNELPYDTYETVELKAVEDKSNTSIIGEQSVDARNDVDVISRNTNDMNIVPDMTLCDTMKCDNAKTEGMAQNKSQMNDDKILEDNVRLENYDVKNIQASQMIDVMEVMSKDSDLHSHKDDKQRDFPDKETNQMNMMDTNISQSSVQAENHLEPLNEISEVDSHNKQNANKIDQENLSTDEQPNVIDEPVIEPLIVKQTKGPSYDAIADRKFTDYDQMNENPIEAVKELSGRMAVTEVKRNIKSPDEDKTHTNDITQPRSEKTSFQMENIDKTSSNKNQTITDILMAKKDDEIPTNESSNSYKQELMDKNRIEQIKIVCDTDKNEDNFKTTANAELVTNESTTSKTPVSTVNTRETTEIEGDIENDAEKSLDRNGPLLAGLSDHSNLNSKEVSPSDTAVEKENTFNNEPGKNDSNLIADQTSLKINSTEIKYLPQIKPNDQSSTTNILEKSTGIPKSAQKRSSSALEATDEAGQEPVQSNTPMSSDKDLPVKGQEELSSVKSLLEEPHQIQKGDDEQFTTILQILDDEKGSDSLRSSTKKAIPASLLSESNSPLSTNINQVIVEDKMHVDSESNNVYNKNELLNSPELTVTHSTMDSTNSDSQDSQNSEQTELPSSAKINIFELPSSHIKSQEMLEDIEDKTHQIEAKNTQNHESEEQSTKSDDTSLEKNTNEIEVGLHVNSIKTLTTKIQEAEEASISTVDRLEEPFIKETKSNDLKQIRFEPNSNPEEKILQTLNSSPNHSLMTQSEILGSFEKNCTETIIEKPLEQAQEASTPVEQKNVDVEKPDPKVKHKSIKLDTNSSDQEDGTVSTNTRDVPIKSENYTKENMGETTLNTFEEIKDVSMPSENVLEDVGTTKALVATSPTEQDIFKADTDTLSIRNASSQEFPEEKGAQQHSIDNIPIETPVTILDADHQIDHELTKAIYDSNDTTVDVNEIDNAEIQNNLPISLNSKGSEKVEEAELKESISHPETHEAETEEQKLIRAEIDGSKKRKDNTDYCQDCENKAEIQFVKDTKFEEAENKLSPKRNDSAQPHDNEELTQNCPETTSKEVNILDEPGIEIPTVVDPSKEDNSKHGDIYKNLETFDQDSSTGDSKHAFCGTSEKTPIESSCVNVEIGDAETISTNPKNLDGSLATDASNTKNENIQTENGENHYIKSGKQRIKRDTAKMLQDLSDEYEQDNVVNTTPETLEKTNERSDTSPVENSQYVPTNLNSSEKIEEFDENEKSKNTLKSLSSDANLQIDIKPEGVKLVNFEVQSENLKKTQPEVLSSSDKGEIEIKTEKFLKGAPEISARFEETNFTVERPDTKKELKNNKILDPNVANQEDDVKIKDTQDASYKPENHANENRETPLDASAEIQNVKTFQEKALESIESIETLASPLSTEQIISKANTAPLPTRNASSNKLSEDISTASSSKVNASVETPANIPADADHQRYHESNEATCDSKDTKADVSNIDKDSEPLESFEEAVFKESTFHPDFGKAETEQKRVSSDLKSFASLEDPVDYKEAIARPKTPEVKKDRYGFINDVTDANEETKDVKDNYQSFDDEIEAQIEVKEEMEDKVISSQSASAQLNSSSALEIAKKPTSGKEISQEAVNTESILTNTQASEDVLVPVICSIEGDTQNDPLKELKVIDNDSIEPSTTLKQPTSESSTDHVTKLEDSTISKSLSPKAQVVESNSEVNAISEIQAREVDSQDNENTLMDAREVDSQENENTPMDDSETPTVDSEMQRIKRENPNRPVDKSDDFEAVNIIKSTESTEEPSNASQDELLDPNSLKPTQKCYEDTKSKSSSADSDNALNIDTKHEESFHPTDAGISSIQLTSNEQVKDKILQRADENVNTVLQHGPDNLHTNEERVQNEKSLISNLSIENSELQDKNKVEEFGITFEKPFDDNVEVQMRFLSDSAKSPTKELLVANEQPKNNEQQCREDSEALNSTQEKALSEPSASYKKLSTYSVENSISPESSAATDNQSTEAKEEKEVFIEEKLKSSSLNNENVSKEDSSETYQPDLQSAFPEEADYEANKSNTKLNSTAPVNLTLLTENPTLLMEKPTHSGTTLTSTDEKLAAESRTDKTSKMNEEDLFESEQNKNNLVIGLQENNEGRPLHTSVKMESKEGTLKTTYFDDPKQLKLELAHDTDENKPKNQQDNILILEDQNVLYSFPQEEQYYQLSPSSENARLESELEEQQGIAHTNVKSEEKLPSDTQIQSISIENIPVSTDKKHQSDYLEQQIGSMENHDKARMKEEINLPLFDTLLEESNNKQLKEPKCEETIRNLNELSPFTEKTEETLSVKQEKPIMHQDEDYTPALFPKEKDFYKTLLDDSESLQPQKHIQEGQFDAGVSFDMQETKSTEKINYSTKSEKTGISQNSPHVRLVAKIDLQQTDPLQGIEEHVKTSDVPLGRDSGKSDAQDVSHEKKCDSSETQDEYFEKVELAGVDPIRPKLHRSVAVLEVDTDPWENKSSTPKISPEPITEDTNQYTSIESKSAHLDQDVDDDSNLSLHDSVRERYNKWMMLQRNNHADQQLGPDCGSEINPKLADVVLTAMDNSKYTDDSLSLADESLGTDSQFYDSLTEQPPSKERYSLNQSASTEHTCISRLSTASCIDDPFVPKSASREQPQHIENENSNVMEADKNEVLSFPSGENYPDSLEASEGHIHSIKIDPDPEKILKALGKSNVTGNKKDHEIQEPMMTSVEMVSSQIQNGQPDNSGADLTISKDFETGEPMFDYQTKYDDQTSGNIVKEQNPNLDDAYDGTKKETSTQIKTTQEICKKEQTPNECFEKVDERSNLTCSNGTYIENIQFDPQKNENSVALNELEVENFDTKAGQNKLNDQTKELSKLENFEATNTPVITPVKHKGEANMELENPMSIDPVDADENLDINPKQGESLLVDSEMPSKESTVDEHKKDTTLQLPDDKIQTALQHGPDNLSTDENSVQNNEAKPSSLPTESSEPQYKTEVDEDMEVSEKTSDENFEVKTGLLSDSIMTSSEKLLILNEQPNVTQIHEQYPKEHLLESYSKQKTDLSENKTNSAEKQSIIENTSDDSDKLSSAKLSTRVSSVEQEINEKLDDQTHNQNIKLSEVDSQIQNSDTKGDSKRSYHTAPALYNSESKMELPVLMNQAAETIQRAFRSYTDAKDMKIEETGNQPIVDLEPIKSIRILETSNELTKNTNPKGMWYVGDDPIITTISKENEDASQDNKEELKETTDLSQPDDNSTQNGLKDIESKSCGSSHTEKLEDSPVSSSMADLKQLSAARLSDESHMPDKAHSNQNLKEANDPSGVEQPYSADSVEATHISTCEPTKAKHLDPNSKSSGNIEVKSIHQNLECQKEPKKILKKSLSTPCAGLKNSKLTIVPLSESAHKSKHEENPHSQDPTKLDTSDSPSLQSSAEDEIAKHVLKLEEEEHISKRSKLTDDTNDSPDATYALKVNDIALPGEVKSDGIEHREHNREVGDLKDYNQILSINKSKKESEEKDDVKISQAPILILDLKNDETIPEQGSYVETGADKRTHKNEGSNFETEANFKGSSLNSAIENTNQGDDDASKDISLVYTSETDQPNTSSPGINDTNFNETFDVDTSETNSEISSQKGLSIPQEESPRSDVENIDISVYGEDSLEAMYYSLKKHELLLDKMHKKASICKSASGEREKPVSQPIAESVKQNTDEEKHADQPLDQNKDGDYPTEVQLIAPDESNMGIISIQNTDNSDQPISKFEEQTNDNESTLDLPPPPRERKLSRNDSYYTACLSRPITSATISPRSRSEHNSENPIKLSKQKTEEFIQQLHADHSLDDTTKDEIRRNMLAYSVSEADSDYCEPGERTNAILNDFNISTAFENTPSTDTDSTIVSAVTKIQAGARGFLTRRRLRRASVATTSFSDRRPSFGNEAIGESLEDLIDEEDAARRIQKSFRRYRNRKTRQSAPNLRNYTEEGNSSKSSNGSSEEGVVKIIDVKVEQKPHIPSKPLEDSAEESKHTEKSVDAINASDKKELDTNSIDQTKYEPEMSLDGVNLATRRMTLQRGDAVQRNSTAESESSSLSGSNSNKSGGSQTSNKPLPPRAKSSGTERRGKNTERNIERAKRFTTRQRSMPVQIDFEIMRVLPRHLRKRIRSADQQNKEKSNF